jgi:uncharacterized protein (DUF1501 family)
MLDLCQTSSRTCQGVSRRHFLRVGALSGVGLALPHWFASRQAAARGKKARDVSCILIWTVGGTSHHDTFDPKPDAPANVRGEFSAISTPVPGVRFTEVAPHLARELGRFALLRSLNPRNGSHGTADYIMMSGHPFNSTMIYPCFGSVVSQQKGFKSPLPPFVQLGSYLDRRFGGGTAGYLGIVHNPFELLADPSAGTFTARDISLPPGIDGGRLDRRRTMLHTVDQLQRAGDQQPEAFAALDKHYQAALNLITAPQTKRAFEIQAEPAPLRERYGMNRLGQSLLLARRLVEAGVRFVTVTDPGWDTHQGNFQSLKQRLMPRIDQGLPQLLADLADRGLLDSTLVVWLTDFGRTPKINSASGRDHWASAGFAAMAGAGIPGGAVLGRTDREGSVPTDAEYFPEDVAATIYTKLGIPLDLITYTPDERPIRLNEGRPIKEWL